MSDNYGFYSDKDFPEKDRAILRAIKKPKDITSFSVESEWTDDHELCLGLNINGVQIGAWWIVRSFACDCDKLSENINNTRARKEVFGYLDYLVKDGESTVKADNKFMDKMNTWKGYNASKCTMIVVPSNKWLLKKDLNHGNCTTSTAIVVTYDGVEKEVHFSFVIGKNVWDALRVLRKSPSDREAIKTVVGSMRTQAKSYLKDDYISKTE